MDRPVTIPHEALAELLRASGSTLTPEAYLASLPEFNEFRKYALRAKVAIWSKYLLLVAVVVSAGCLPIGFGFESILVTLILTVLTYFEFRVHQGFLDQSPQAPTLGFRNQSAFAAFIVVYCLYHAFTPVQLPAGYREFMDPDMTNALRTFTIATYVAVGVVGGVSQFCLAWFYWFARVPSQK